MELTHEELLAKISRTDCCTGAHELALLEIVKGHSPVTSPYSENLINCRHCMAQEYPCRTIRAIEEEFK